MVAIAPLMRRSMPQFWLTASPDGGFFFPQGQHKRSQSQWLRETARCPNFPGVSRFVLVRHLQVGPGRIWLWLGRRKSK